MGTTKSNLKNWPTPCVAIARNGCPSHSARLRRKRKQGWTIELHDMASSGMMENENWATPNTMDHLALRSDEALERQANGARKGRAKPANLREQVDQKSCEIYSQNWPTPDCSDRRSKNSKQQGLSNKA